MLELNAMTDDLKSKKESLREEAKRARGLMSLSAEEHEQLCSYFFDNVQISDGGVVAAYWPKGRELDTHFLIDHCLDRGLQVALPVIEDDNHVLKFAAYNHGDDLTTGKFGVCHPVLDDNTKWLEPDVFLVPLLAFDRRGNRLGYGGGYYDATLAHYKDKKEILAVGLGYAKQACLFNLPAEEHDIAMDWIITEQGAQSF